MCYLFHLLLLDRINLAIHNGNKSCKNGNKTFFFFLNQIWNVHKVHYKVYCLSFSFFYALFTYIYPNAIVILTTNK